MFETAPKNAKRIPQLSKHHAQRMLVIERLVSRPPMHAFSILASQSYPPISARLPKPHSLVHRTQQLCLQDELPLLILLTRLVRLVVLPPHCLLTLSAHYVPYSMPAGGHISICGF